MKTKQEKLNSFCVHPQLKSSYNSKEAENLMNHNSSPGLQAAASSIRTAFGTPSTTSTQTQAPKSAASSGSSTDHSIAGMVTKSLTRLKGK